MEFSVNHPLPFNLAGLLVAVAIVISVFALTKGLGDQRSARQYINIARLMYKKGLL